MSSQIGGESSSSPTPGHKFSSSFGSFSTSDTNRSHNDKNAHTSRQDKLESFSEEWVQRTAKGFSANRHSTESIGDLIAGVKAEDALKLATLTKRKPDKKDKVNAQGLFHPPDESKSANSLNNDSDWESHERADSEGVMDDDRVFAPSPLTQQQSNRYKQFMNQRYAQIFHLIAIKECYNPLDIVRNREARYQEEQGAGGDHLSEEGFFNKKRNSDEFLPNISSKRACSRWGFDNSEMSSYYLKCDTLKTRRSGNVLSDGENVKIRRLSLSSRFSFNSEPHEYIENLDATQLKGSSSLKLLKFKKTWGSGIFRRKGKQSQKKIRPSLDQDITSVPRTQQSRRFSMDEAATSEPSAMISKASSLTHIPGYSLPDREALQMKARKENTTTRLPDVPAKALPITTEHPISGVPIVASAFTTAPIDIELPSHKPMHTQNLDPKIENTAQKSPSKQPSDSPDLRRSQEKDTAPYFLGGLPIQPHSRQLSLPDVKKYVAREELIPNENLKISTTSSELISDEPQDSKYSNTGVAPDNAANLVNIDDLPPGLASLVLEFLKSPTDWSNESVENVPTEDAPESTNLEATQRNEVPPVVEEIKKEESNHSDTSLERYNSSANEDQESKLEYYELNVTGNVSKSTVIPPAKLIEMVTAKINVAAKENNSLYRKIWMDQIVDQCNQHIKYTKINIENFERDWKKKINTIEQYINRGNKTTDDIPLNTATPTVSPIIRPRSLSSVSYKIPESPNLSPSMGNSHWSSSLRLGSIFLENWSRRKVVKDECQTFETMYTDMRQKLAEMENRITNVSSVQKRAGQDIHSNYQEVKKISEIIDHQYYHQLKLLEDQMQRILDSRSSSYLQEFFFTILSYVLAATGYLFWIIAILFIMLKRVFSLPFLSASRKRKIEAKSH